MSKTVGVAVGNHLNIRDEIFIESCLRRWCYPVNGLPKIKVAAINSVDVYSRKRLVREWR